VTPVGGGGLLSGSAISAKSHNASIKVIGVEPAEADDAYQSWKSGRIVTLSASPTTMADGVRTVAIGERNFEVMFTNRLVDEIVTVTEDEIANAVKVAWSRLHLALEPTGTATPTCRPWLHSSEHDPSQGRDDTQCHLVPRGHSNRGDHDDSLHEAHHRRAGHVE
jgi:threonine dehydratase